MGKTIRKDSDRKAMVKADARRRRVIRAQKSAGAYFPPGSGDWPSIIDFKEN